MWPNCYKVTNLVRSSCILENTCSLFCLYASQVSDKQCSLIILLSLIVIFASLMLSYKSHTSGNNETLWVNSLVRQGGTRVFKYLKEKFSTNSSVLKKSYEQLTWCAAVINMIYTASILYILVVVLYFIVVYGPKEAVGLEVIYTPDHDVHPR